MKQYRLLTLVSVLVLAMALPLFADAEAAYGASGVRAGEEYSLEEMLVHAIQDEYLARAEYEAIIKAFGTDRPYSAIVLAEENHIVRLAALFVAHGYAVPADEAAGHFDLPGTLAETYGDNVTAETNNIAMYEAFLSQENLPGDARLTFEALARASQNHLRAFERWAQNAGFGNGRGNGRRR